MSKFKPNDCVEEVITGIKGIITEVLPKGKHDVVQDYHVRYFWDGFRLACLSESQLKKSEVERYDT